MLQCASTYAQKYWAKHVFLSSPGDQQLQAHLFNKLDLERATSTTASNIEASDADLVVRWLKVCVLILVFLSGLIITCSDLR